jgi:NAD(P)H-hydrate epimerase
VTVITNGTQTSVNIRGNSGQAKGGSGDVLSGVIAGLCAVGVSAFNSARIAAFATGRAAEIACEKSSEYSLTATDVISYLGASFFEIEGAGTR